MGSDPTGVENGHECGLIGLLAHLLAKFEEQEAVIMDAAEELMKILIVIVCMGTDRWNLCEIAKKQTLPKR